MPSFGGAGVTLEYEVTGSGEQSWLIFSNSLGANLSMWQRQVPALSRSLRVLRYDNRGHGRSSVPPGPYTMDHLGADVLSLADHVGAARFHFCGLSMGGLIGQWLGLNAPQRLRGLVLCDTAAKIGTADAWDERIRTVERSGMSAIVEGGLERWFTPRLFSEDADTVEQFRSMILATDPTGYVANCKAIRDADFRASLRAISVPALVVCGTHDPVTTPADGRFLVDSIAGARMLELDAAHLSNVEQADAFNRGVLDFIEMIGSA